MTASSLTLAGFTGLSSITARAIGGEAHLRQSIRDILTTPIGSRVMQREYGSRVPALIDTPMSRGFVADLVAAVADALNRWEPRVALKRVQVASAVPGRAVLDLTLIDAPGRLFSLQVTL